LNNGKAYEARFPMSVRAIDIMELMRLVPGAQCLRVVFSRPGAKGDDTDSMKRIYLMVGPKVPFENIGGQTRPI